MSADFSADQTRRLIASSIQGNLRVPPHNQLTHSYQVNEEKIATIFILAKTAIFLGKRFKM